MITVPESLAFYWSEPANRAAVNVLAGKTEVPPDLTLDEVERFEVASLASERVRLDFWRMLRSLWSATFGAAIRAELPSARFLNFGDHGSVIPASDLKPSIQKAWDEGLTYGVHHVPEHGHLVTCVWLDPATTDRDMALEFYFFDADGRLDISDGLEIGPEWGTREGWRATHCHSLAFSDDRTTIDVASFDALSRSAMSALAETIKSKGSVSSMTSVPAKASKIRSR